MADARPDRLQPRIIQRHAVEIGADPDANDARRVGDALKLLQRGLDVRQRQRGETADAVRIALRALDHRVV